jgi:hypothetical protein
MSAYLIALLPQNWHHYPRHGLSCAVLPSVHGFGKIRFSLSDYYIADKIQGTYRGRMIAIPRLRWGIFASPNKQQMGLALHSFTRFGCTRWYEFIFSPFLVVSILSSQQKRIVLLYTQRIYVIRFEIFDPN